MKKFIAIILAFSFTAALFPSEAEAAGLSLAQRRQMLFLRVRLARIPAGRGNPALIRRLTLQLTRLAPARAGAWLARATPLFSPANLKLAEELTAAVVTVIEHSALPPAAKEKAEKKANEIGATPTPSPTSTPTPYSA